MTAITVRGTLNADGTILLDTPPDLPPGRVEVTVKAAAQFAAAVPEESTWDLLDHIWAEPEEEGHSPRTREEIDEEIRWIRGEW